MGSNPPDHDEQSMSPDSGVEIFIVLIVCVLVAVLLFSSG